MSAPNIRRLMEFLESDNNGLQSAAEIIWALANGKTTSGGVDLNRIASEIVEFSEEADEEYQSEKATEERYCAAEAAWEARRDEALIREIESRMTL